MTATCAPVIFAKDRPDRDPHIPETWSAICLCGKHYRSPSRELTWATFCAHLGWHQQPYEDAP